MKLKHAASFTAGGTPSVDDPSMWEIDEQSGTPWISIGDMSGADIVTRTARRISKQGIADRRLRIGQPGTVLFAMYASVGAVATLSEPATWNQALLGVTPHDGKADSRFIAYWLQHAARDAMADVRSSTQNNLNADQVANFPFPDLPVEDQRRIADFLDDQVSRIDNIISARRKQIELAQTSVWSQIVATLIGPRTEVLGSAPWFRGLPKSWSLLSLRQRWTVVDCKHRTPSYVDDGVPVISPGDISKGRLDLSRATRFVGGDDYLDLADPLRRCLPGDVVYSRNASAGTAAYVETASPFTMGQDVCRITSSDQSQLFLSYVLNYLCLPQLDSVRIGSTFTRINIDQIKAFAVPTPPSEIQRDVAYFCDSLVAASEKSKSYLHGSAALLTEYKQSLITAAVTGELDVTTASTRITA